LRRPGEEELDMVIQFGHGAHGGAGGAHRIGPIDSDGRWDTFDALGVGLIHPIEKLPGRPIEQSGKLPGLDDQFTLIPADGRDQIDIN
jgi:hypothetical protein